MFDIQKVLIFGLILLLQEISSAPSDNTAKYLKEPPEFLKPCKIHEKPQNSACFAKVLEDVFQNWKNGVPGIEGFSSIDPFTVKRIRISQEGENINMKMEMRNMSSYGFSKLKAKGVIIDEKDYTMKMDIDIPFLRTITNYKIKGKMFGLNLDTEGVLDSNVTALNIIAEIKSDLKEHDGLYFLDVKSYKADVKSIGNLHLQFTNLFGGNKELEDSANELFNTIWREMFEILRPTVSEAFNTIISSRFKKIFNYVPISYSFSDLP